MQILGCAFQLRPTFELLRKHFPKSLPSRPEKRDSMGRENAAHAAEPSEMARYQNQSGGMSSSKGHSNMNSTNNEFEPEIEFDRQYEPLEVQAGGSAGQVNLQFGCRLCLPLSKVGRTATIALWHWFCVNHLFW